MIIDIDDKLLSSDLFTECFSCYPEICAGVCCIHGDSGAPISENEKEIIEKNFEKIKPYMEAAGIKAIEQQGFAVVDIDGELVTPLVNGEECAYAVYDNNFNCYCSIESAYTAKKIDFCKPISCHLYPIRVKKTAENVMLNYDQWSICQCARDKGSREKIRVYEFLKEPLIRCFGKEFYEKIEQMAEIMKSTNI